MHTSKYTHTCICMRVHTHTHNLLLLTITLLAFVPIPYLIFPTATPLTPHPSSFPFKKKKRKPIPQLTVDICLIAESGVCWALMTWVAQKAQWLGEELLILIFIWQSSQLSMVGEGCVSLLVWSLLSLSAIYSLPQLPQTSSALDYDGF